MPPHSLSSVFLVSGSSGTLQPRGFGGPVSWKSQGGRVHPLAGLLPHEEHSLPLARAPQVIHVPDLTKPSPALVVPSPHLPGDLARAPLSGKAEAAPHPPRWATPEHSKTGKTHFLVALGPRPRSAQHPETQKWKPGRSSPPTPGRGASSGHFLATEESPQDFLSPRQTLPDFHRARGWGGEMGEREGERIRVRMREYVREWETE